MRTSIQCWNLRQALKWPSLSSSAMLLFNRSHARIKYGSAFGCILFPLAVVAPWSSLVCVWLLFLCMEDCYHCENRFCVVSDRFMFFREKQRRVFVEMTLWPLCVPQLLLIWGRVFLEEFASASLFITDYLIVCQIRDQNNHKISKYQHLLFVYLQVLRCFPIDKC